MLLTLLFLAIKKKTFRIQKEVIKNYSFLETVDKRYKRIQNNIKDVNYKYKINERKEKMYENENEIKSTIVYKRNSAKLMQTGKTIIGLNSPIKKTTSSTNGYVIPSFTSFNLNI